MSRFEIEHLIQGQYVEIETIAQMARDQNLDPDKVAREIIIRADALKYLASKAKAERLVEDLHVEIQKNETMANQVTLLIDQIRDSVPGSGGLREGKVWGPIFNGHRNGNNL